MLAPGRNKGMRGPATPAQAAEAVLAWLPEPALLVGPEDRIAGLNPAAADLLGLPEREVLGREVGVFLPGVQDHLPRGGGAEATRLEVVLQSAGPDAHPLPVEVCWASPPDGGTRGPWVLLLHESNRFAAEAPFRDFVEAAPDAVLVVDATGRIGLANAEAERLFGYPRAVLVGMAVETLVPARARAVHEEHRRRYQEAPRTRPMGAGLELAAVRRDGTEVPVEISLSPVQAGGKTLVIAAVRDVSDRRREERRIRMLQAMAGEVSVADSVQAALEVALERVCEANDWDLGEAWIPDERGDFHWTCAWHRGGPRLDAFVEASRRMVFGKGRGIMGNAAERQEPVWFEDLQHEEAFLRKEQAGAAGLRSAVAIPVPGSGQPAAVMVFFLAKPHTVDFRFLADVGAVAAQLGTAIDRKQAEDALRRSEALLAEAQATAHLGSWSWDVPSNQVVWSDELYRIYGVKQQDSLGSYETFLELVHPDDRAQVAETVRLAMERGEDYVVLHRLVRPDGTVRWIHGRGAVALGPGGEVVRIHGTAEDVTERKAAEDRLRESLQEKEVLLQEVHHRVKNNLQIVSSMLNLQAHRTDDPQSLRMFKDSRDRVQAMALVHEKMYMTRHLDAVPILDYIGDLAASVCRNNDPEGRRPVALELDVEDAVLDIDLAVGLGLMVNELLSNCCKHAFPRGAGGNIRVAFRTTPEEYHLEVEDDGVGYPSDLPFPAPDTLGMKLVVRLVEQHRGSIVLHRGTAPDGRGTAFRITLPRPAPSDQARDRDRSGIPEATP
jgi:PAS domain S-box-containing protein